MRITTETITPEIARDWLQHNIQNRAVKPWRVTGYAEDMKAGRWPLNGETIKFDEDGRLIDGQHRLLACIEAGIPFTSLVVRGLHPTARRTVDGGIIRTPADVLRMEGEEGGFDLAGALTWLARYELGDMSAPLPCKSTALIEKMLTAHPRVRESLKVRTLISGIMPRSLATALHYIFGLYDAERRDDLFEGLSVKSFRGADWPHRLLKERLLLNATQRNSKLKSEYIAAITIKSWNAAVLGTQLQKLQWMAGRGDKFPTIERKAVR